MRPIPATYLQVTWRNGAGGGKEGSHLLARGEASECDYDDAWGEVRVRACVAFVHAL